MENWFEILIPVIIVLLYLFQRMRGGDDELESPPRSESETSEEARRIQEEIRRKIVARQQGRDPAEVAPPSEPEMVPSESTGHFERYGQEAEIEDRGAGSFRDASMPSEFERYSEETVAAGPVAAGPARDYQAELREQLQRVQESKKARQQASRKAKDTVRRAPGEIGSLGGADFQYGAGRVQRRYRTYSRETLLDELHDREGLRKAFVLREVLGRPVGLRSPRDSYAEFSGEV